MKAVVLSQHTESLIVLIVLGQSVISVSIRAVYFKWSINRFKRLFRRFPWAIDRQDRCGLIFIVMLRNQNLPSSTVRI